MGRCVGASARGHVGSRPHAPPPCPPPERGLSAAAAAALVLDEGAGAACEAAVIRSDGAARPLRCQEGVSSPGADCERVDRDHAVRHRPHLPLKPLLERCRPCSRPRGPCDTRGLHAAPRSVRASAAIPLDPHGTIVVPASVGRRVWVAHRRQPRRWRERIRVHRVRRAERLPSQRTGRRLSRHQLLPSTPIWPIALACATRRARSSVPGLSGCTPAAPATFVGAAGGAGEARGALLEQLLARW